MGSVRSALCREATTHHALHNCLIFPTQEAPDVEDETTTCSRRNQKYNPLSIKRNHFHTQKKKQIKNSVAERDKVMARHHEVVSLTPERVFRYFAFWKCALQQIFPAWLNCLRYLEQTCVDSMASLISNPYK